MSGRAVLLGHFACPHAALIRGAANRDSAAHASAVLIPAPRLDTETSVLYDLVGPLIYTNYTTCCIKGAK